MSVMVDWKPERAVQAKIRGIQKNTIPVDWKPERAVQAKVRDSKNKRSKKTMQKKSMTSEVYPRESTQAVLQMATSARLLINGLYPRGMFTSSSTTTSSTITIFKKVGRVCVFATWVWFSPQPSSFVSSSYLPSHIFVHTLYIHNSHTHTFTQITHTHMHTYIHLCIYMHIFINIHFHAHTYRGHLYTIASTTLSLDSSKSKQKQTKWRNVIPSVSNPKISPSIQFK